MGPYFTFTLLAVIIITSSSICHSRYLLIEVPGEDEIDNGKSKSNSFLNKSQNIANKSSNHAFLIDKNAFQVLL